MKQAIILTIICNYQPAIDAVVAQIPAQNDPRIWSDDYQPATISIFPANPIYGTSEATHITAAFRCYNDIDQAAIAEAIIQAVMDNIAYVGGGSLVRLHMCYHDETPQRSCIETILYEVR